MQAVKAPPSRRHSKLVTPEPPVSLPEKLKLAEEAPLCAGGLLSIWVCGGVESSTYVRGEEQAERFAASSVTVALNLVVVSSGTETVTPASSSAAVVVAIGEPEQPTVV